MASAVVKILLVDDLSANLIALEGLLKTEGLELIQATSGREALEALLVHEIALAIVDVQMPEMNGFELAEIMRSTARTRRIPIIFLTAAGPDHQRRFRGYEAGAVDFLYKPIEPHVLQSKVTVFIELARQRHELREANERLEQKVAERTAHLRDVNQQLETFCYSIAHDLRAPLRAQEGFAHLLLENYGPQLDDEGRDYASRIILAASRLDRLVNDLLAFSRVSREQIVTKPIVLSEIVALSLGTLDGQTKAAGAQITTRDLNHKVNANEAVLQTVITNLLENALKFRRPGVQPKVDIYAEILQSSCVRLSIEDDGIGIAPEHFKQIFGVFNRLHRNEDYSGTGIGLAIVEKGIERMGGRVGVESKADRGSRFWLELPASE